MRRRSTPNPVIRQGTQLKYTLEQFPDTIVTSQEELDILLKEGYKLRKLSGISPMYRQEWSDFHALREFIQNALDAGDNTYEFVHVPGPVPGVIISDKGTGITLEHLVLGQFKEDTESLAARGRFGEGLKLACVALLRQGKKIEISTVNYDFIPAFYIKFVEDPAKDEQFEELTFGFLYKQNHRKQGTDVTIYGQEESYSDLILLNHRDSVIASFNVREPQLRAFNVGAVTQAELVRPYYRPSHDKQGPCIYIKDIWVQDLALSYHTYSYNFAFVISPKAGSGLDPEVQPNRDAVNDKAVIWAINRLWVLLIASGDYQNIVTSWFQSLVDIAAGQRGEKLSVREANSIDPFEWKIWSGSTVYGCGPNFNENLKKEVAKNIALALELVTYKHPETERIESFPSLDRIVFVETGPLARRARIMGYVPVTDLLDWHGINVLKVVFELLNIPGIEEKELLDLMEIKGVQTIPEHKLTKKQVQVLHNVNIIISRLYDNRSVVYESLRLDDPSEKQFPSIKLSDGLTDLRTSVATLGKHIPSRNEIILDWSNCINRDPNGTTRFMFATLVHEFSHWIRNSNDGTESFREDLEAVWHLNIELYAVDRVYKKAVDMLLVKGNLKKFIKLEEE